MTDRLMTPEAYAAHQAKHGRPKIVITEQDILQWSDAQITASEKALGTKTEPAPYVVPVKPKKAAKKPKYGNVKTADAHSLKESRRMSTLRTMQTAGVISNLAFQVRYMLVPKQQKADGSHERSMTYTCDAQYVENGKLVVEDTKSEVTRKLPRYIAARKLMLKLFGIEIRET